ncbi:AAA family ATPase [Kutzneria albida]|uniref:HTH luxR-type domain-containing protein n=1 Tax=Kutzneria albida DSM 43870 TaxID=1449976 RepID=W5WAR6_9PSEU|nr:AAA family ATPase [Kutzneria albida]AHH97855.1 hypothetical protein KALB_4493 [Kutzneria albida DSM 43870]
MNSPATALFGKQHLIEQLLGFLDSKQTAPVLVIGGPAGVGRSTAMAALGAAARANGVTTLVVRMRESDRSRPHRGVMRVDDALSEVAADPAQQDAEQRTVTRTATRLADSLLGLGPAFVLIDDAQWVDGHSRAALTTVARRLVGSPAKLVLSLRTPRPAELPACTQEDALVHAVRLPPLDRAESRVLLGQVLGARLTPRLADRLHELGGGLPGALIAAARGYQRAGAVRVSDHHAYLVHEHLPPQVDLQDPVLADVRRLPPHTRAVALGMAVLAPLGEAATGLLAGSLDRPEQEVRQALDELTALGLLTVGPDRRFRSPLLAEVLPAKLGPYARRRLASAAVRAVWQGAARSADPFYLPEQLAISAGMVDPERTGAELLTHAEQVVLIDHARVVPWLRAAAELPLGRQEQVRSLRLLTVTSLYDGQWQRAAESAERLLAEHADLLTADHVQCLQLMYVTALLALRDFGTLDNLIAGDWGQLSGGPAQRIVSSACALSMLDRFRQAHELLESTRSTWQGAEGFTSVLGEMFADQAARLLGLGGPLSTVLDRTARLLAPVEELNRQAVAAAYARTSLTINDLSSARAAMSRLALPEQALNEVDLAVLRFLAGHWDEALAISQLAIVRGTPTGNPLGHTGMYRAMARIHLARGSLSEARSIIAKARAEQQVADHLLSSVDADVELLLTNVPQADRLLREGLAVASRRGVLAGTDDLLLGLAQLRSLPGALPEDRDLVACTGRVATAVDTRAAWLNHLLTRALVLADPDSAASALALARASGQPFELANTIFRLAGAGFVTAKLVHEGYALYGQLRALLSRARTRHLMRELNIPVPDRRAATAENEYLLATLVTDGLSNRTVAAVLHTSERSVESRLSRLFKHTGYRSRVELATAMLAGQFELQL